MISKVLMNIVSKFKFETGSSMLNISNVQKGFDGLSKSAKSLENQMKGLMTTTSMSVTGGFGGIVGVIKQATDASEKFYLSARKLATLTTGSHTKLQLQTRGPTEIDNEYFSKFANSMENATKQINRVAQEASQFGIDAGQFVDAFTTLNAILLPKGAAGKNYEQVRSLARNSMLGASVLGLEDWQVRDRITSLVAGEVQNPQQLLFRRLKQETEAFQGLSLSQFNAMKMKKRVETVNKAFDQFLDKPGVLESHLRSLSVQMTILRNRTMGLDSVFKDVGFTIRTVTVDALIEVNKWILEKFKPALNTITREIGRHLTGLDRLKDAYVQVNKLSRLSTTWDFSKTVAGFGFLVFELGALLVTLLGVVRTTKVFGGSLYFLNAVLIKGLTLLTSFRWILSFVIAGLTKFLKIFTGVFILFRIIDSAKAQAKLRDLEKGINTIDKFAESMVFLSRKMMEIMSPAIALIDELASSFAHLFSYSFWGKFIEGFLRSTVVVDSVAVSMGILHKVFVGLQTATVGVLKTFENLYEAFSTILKQGVGGAFDQFKENQQALALSLVKFQMAKEKSFYEALQQRQLKDLLPNVQKNVLNIAKVEIRNQFKENIEPDRVAVAIKDLFEKSVNAQIDTTSRPQVFSGSYTGPRGI